MSALESLARQVKRSRVVPKQIVYKKQKPRFIDATERVMELKQEKQQQSGEWKKCRHLKTVGNQFGCGKFMSLCSKEKCDARFMEIVEN